MQHAVEKAGNNTQSMRRRGTRSGVLLASVAMRCWMAWAPLIVGAKPCSESDVYSGYPLPKHLEFGAVRPYPLLLDCSQLDLANVGLTAEEALLLTRAVGQRINGEFRNISVVISKVPIRVTSPFHCPVPSPGLELLF